jgi:hypothetical protein
MGRVMKVSLTITRNVAANKVLSTLLDCDDNGGVFNMICTAHRQPLSMIR